MAREVLNGPPNGGVAMAKAAARALPGSNLLPFFGGSGQIPDRELVLEGVTIDPEHLAAYNKVCGFTMRDSLPTTYPHILAFPLHMALLTDGAFPFPAIGMVHIANKIAVKRPIGTSETLEVSVHAGDLEPHAKGQQFALITQVRIDGDLIWEGCSTNLRRGSGGSDAPAKTSSGDNDEGLESEVKPGAEWSLPGHLGRSYAAASGDRNPIHMHALSAKAFGFPRAIAHGMWTKARCLAALEGNLPAAHTVEVAFKRPILLPSRVSFNSSDPANKPIAFTVTDAKKGTPHLAGTLIAD